MSSKLLTIQLLEELVHAAELNQEGKTADYIPELANVNQELTAIAVQPLGEKTLAYSNNPLHRDFAKHWEDDP